MSVDTLRRDGFIPERAVDLMSNTKPGRLAAILDQILYDGAVGEVACEGLERQRRFSAPERVFCSGAKHGPGADGYHDVMQALRDVRDYLEGCALKEVLR